MSCYFLLSKTHCSFSLFFIFPKKDFLSFWKRLLGKYEIILSLCWKQRRSKVTDSSPAAWKHLVLEYLRVFPWCVHVNLPDSTANAQQECLDFPADDSRPAPAPQRNRQQVSQMSSSRSYFPLQVAEVLGENETNLQRKVDESQTDVGVSAPPSHLRLHGCRQPHATVFTKLGGALWPWSHCTRGRRRVTNHAQLDFF